MMPHHQHPLAPLLSPYVAPGDAAAAAAKKAQKKLLKLQGIASQAQQAHAGIIIDDTALQDSSSDEADERMQGPEGGSSGSKAAANRASTGAAGSDPDKRKGPAGAAQLGGYHMLSQHPQPSPNAALPACFTCMRAVAADEVLYRCMCLP